jgi:hypothetical protein
MSEDLKKLILEFLQESGWKLRKNIAGLSNARMEDDPVRLVLTVSNDIGKPELNYKGTDIPVELEVVEEAKPVIMVEGKDGSGPTAETEMKAEKDNDDLVHREFSDQARSVFNIGDALGPHVSEQDAKGKGDLKSQAYEAWQKRHKNVKIVRNDPED